MTSSTSSSRPSPDSDTDATAPVDTGGPGDSRTAGTPRAADGRIPGRRGRATRDRLLQATSDMLETESYRDLKVVDIARSVGTSPATFYQYFPDVEAAVLQLAREVVEDVEILLAPLGDASLTGRAGYKTVLALVDAFLDFWDSHQAVLRVVDLAIVEGDARFRAIRNELIEPVISSLADAVADMQKRGRGNPDLDPKAQASVLVSMLAHVSEHRAGLEAWGVKHDDARHSMARVIYWTVTGRKPPNS